MCFIKLECLEGGGGGSGAPRSDLHLDVYDSGVYTYI